MSGRNEISGACPGGFVCVSALRLTATVRAAWGSAVNEVGSTTRPSTGRGSVLAPALSMGLPARSVTPAPTVKSICERRVPGAVCAQPTSIWGSPAPSTPVTARAGEGVQVPA